MNRQSILVVDDEARMRELIRLYLQKEFDVAEAADGESALRYLGAADPSLVILDVMMPRLDGWATLQRIRESSGVPVIMLTARGDVPDRVQGLKLGADDYMAKPFDGRELVARVQAVLRRTTGNAELQPVIKRGDLELRPSERIVTWRGRTLALTPREYDLLTMLAAHAGQAFARERLLAAVWGPAYEGDDRTVDSPVKNLREKLGDGAAMITTIWGVGYRFVELPRAPQS